MSSSSDDEKFSTSLTSKEILKCKIECKRICRLSRDQQDDFLDKQDEIVKNKKIHIKKRDKAKMMIKLIEEHQERQDNAYNNMAYDTIDGGFESFQGGTGCDAG